MSQTTTILPINPTTFELQDYSTQDTSLISNFTVEPTFDPSTNYVTYFIYDLNGNVVFASEINFQGYNLIDQEVYIDPENANSDAVAADLLDETAEFAALLADAAAIVA